MRRWTDFLEQMKYSFEQQCNRFHDLPVSDFLGPDEPDDLGPYCFMMSNRFSISSWKIQYDLTMKFHQRFLETKSQSFEWLVRSGVDNSNLRRARKIEFKQRPKCFCPFRCYIKQTSFRGWNFGLCGPNKKLSRATFGRRAVCGTSLSKIMAKTNERPGEFFRWLQISSRWCYDWRDQRRILWEVRVH